MAAKKKAAPRKPAPAPAAPHPAFAVARSALRSLINMAVVATSSAVTLAALMTALKLQLA